MNKDLTTVTVNKATYELMKEQAKLDDRSVRAWLQRHISASFSEPQPQLKEPQPQLKEPQPQLKAPQPQLKAPEPITKSWYQIYMGQTGRKKMSMYETYLEYGPDPL